MKNEILFCKKCNIYTLNKICTNCNSVTITTKSAKFSLADKYGKYRRIYKNEMVS